MGEIQLKRCIKCFIEKPFNEYHWQNKAENKRRSDCKECFNNYQLRRVNRKRAYVLDYLSTHPCIDCGESDIVVLEFDHVRGIKRFNVSFAVQQSNSLADVIQEIEKCDVRCANCHKRVTYGRATSYRCN